MCQSWAWMTFGLNLRARAARKLARTKKLKRSVSIWPLEYFLPCITRPPTYTFLALKNLCLMRITLTFEPGSFVCQRDIVSSFLSKGTFRPVAIFFGLNFLVSMKP